MIDKNILQHSSDLELLQSGFVTGKPTSDYARSVLDKYKPSARQTGLNPFSGGTTPAIQVPTGPDGGRYPYFSPFVPSNEDLYGSYQSWYSKAGHGILKGAGLALTTFLNGTAGLITGVSDAIATGKMSSFYDNTFTRALDQANEYMERQFPNYYSDKETGAAWYSPSNLFTANFLFDKVIKNLGYSVGALGAGVTYAAALRSLGLFSKIASAGGLAQAAELSESMAGAVPEIGQAAAGSAGVRTAAERFLSRFNTLNTAQRAVAAGLATIGEANFEALLQLNKYRQDLIAEYVREHGVRPTGQDLETINRYAEKSGNAVFALNIPLLTATNYIQLPKILGSSFRAERNLFTNSIRQAAGVALDREAGRFISTLPKTWLGKAMYRAKNISSLLFSRSEAFEELSQTAFNFGVENYYDKARRGQDTDILGDMLGEGYRQALSTKEGLESMLIGGISGGIFNFRGNIRERGFDGFGGQRAEANKGAIAVFNKHLFSPFLNDTRDSVNRGAAIQADRMEAIRRGDFLEARELQTDYTLNYLAPRVKYGRYDLVKDDLETYRKLASTSDGLQQLKDQGVISDDTTQEQLLGRIRNLATHADNINDLYQALHIRYGGLIDKEGKRLYEDEIIDKMVYAAAKISDYDQRVPSLSASLTEHGINVQPILDEVATTGRPTEDVVKTALQQIDNLDLITDTKDNIRDDLRDLLELSLRRKEFLREYDQLKNKPEEYITAKYGRPAADNSQDTVIIPQMDEQGNTVDFAVTPGATYAPSAPITRQGNSFSFQPSVNIGAPSLLGDMRLDYSDGTSVYRFAGQMADMRLDKGYSELELGVLTDALNNVIEQVAALPAYAALAPQIKDASFSERLKIIGALDDTGLSDELQQRFNKVIADFASTRKTLGQLADPAFNTAIETTFSQAESEAAATETSDPAADKALSDSINENEGAKKHISILFKSSTSANTAIQNITENDDFHRRVNKFLENLNHIADRPNVKVIAVTAANQDYVGLSDFISQAAEGSGVSATDIDEGVIRLVFIRSTAAGDYFVDMQGVNLTAVGTRPDYTQLVYTTMPSTSLTWKNNELRYISTGKRAATAEKAKTYQDAYRIKRTQMLSLTDTYDVFPFTVSRGFPTYDKTGKQYAVTESLVDPTSLDSTILLVPTHGTSEAGGRPTGSIIHGEETIELPLGRPVLQHGATFAPLNNRRLSDREKRVIKQLIIRLAASASKGKVDRAILDYFQGLLYWRKPVAAKAPTKGQVWYQSGYLYLGSRDNKVPFLENIISRSAAVDQFLDDVFVTANNFILTQRASLPFNEIIDIDSASNLVQVQWKSYQHFLLADTFITTTDDTSGLNGSSRATSEIPLTTDIAPVGVTGDKYATVFQQRYVTLHTLNLFPHATAKAGNADPISDQDYKDFVDKGLVSAAILVAIAEKVISQTPLSARESAIFASRTAEINSIIGDTAAKTVPAPGQAAVSSQTEEAEKILQAGEYILDGVTMNLVRYEGRKLGKVSATIAPDGSVQLTGYTHILKKTPDTLEFRETVYAIAKAAISEAVYQYLEQRSGAKSELTPEAAVEPEPAQQTTEPVAANPAEEQPAGSGSEAAPGSRTAEDIFKGLKPRRSGGMTGGNYRTLGRFTFRLEDIRTFREYVSRVIPTIAFHEVETLIRRTDGGFAWGAFENNAIYLFRYAEEGTGYHEVFEAVFATYLTDGQQQDIIREFKRRKGSFTDRVSGKQIQYRNATRHQAKEQIAEEFREYNLSGTLPAAPRIAGFFRRLLHFIKSVLIGKPMLIRDLFSRINKGMYASATPLRTDKSSQPSYREKIPGLSTQFIQEVMEGMTVLVFEELFDQNRSLVEFDEFKISLPELYSKVFDKMKVYFDEVLPENMLADVQQEGLSDKEAARAMEYYAEQYNNIWVPIKNNWVKFVSLNESFLKPFNIFFDAEASEDEHSSPAGAENKSGSEYARDILKINARKNASTAVKLLFATLAEVEQDQVGTAQEDPLTPPDRMLSGIKLPKLTNYAKTFNRLMYAVQGFVNPSDFLERIKKLAGKDKTFVRLYNRLKVGLGYDQLSLYDWKLLIKLYSVAARQHPDYFIQINDETGRTYLAPANDNRETTVLSRTWLNNLKASAGPGKLITIDRDRYRVNTKVLADFKSVISEMSGKLLFLNAFGITFSQADYDGLPGADKKKFKEAAQGLFNTLLKSADISTLSGRSLGISGPLTKLADVIVRNNGQQSEGQHFNIEGDPVQNLVLHNYVSAITGDINHYSTKEQLVQALPHLGDIFSAGSLLLENGGPLFDDKGNRRPESINISIIEGAKTVGPRKGTPTSKLSLARRRLLEFNQNLNGIYYLLVPADSTTEWALNLESFHYIAFSELGNRGALANKIFRIFSSYLEDEMNLIADYDNRSHVENIAAQGKHLRFFKGILKQHLGQEAAEAALAGKDARAWIAENRERIASAIDSWLQGLVDKQYEYFREYDIISTTEKDLLQFNGLDSDFRENNHIAENLTEQDIKDLILFRVLNYAISNTEIHKVFFGDPAAYTDSTKRIKSFLSGRETTYHSDSHFNTFAGKHLNRTALDKNGIALRPGDPGYWVFKNHMDTATLSDVIIAGSISMDMSLPEDIRKAYEEANEADAQSWMLLPAYRELLLKSAGRWTDAMERQFQYEMAYERMQKAALGSFSYKGREDLLTHDSKLVNAGNPAAATFHVIKPIGTGIKAAARFADVFLDKTSAVPIFYRMAQGRNLQQLYDQMSEKGLSYVIMKSGRKVGAEKQHSLYQADGSFNTAAFNNRVSIPFRYYGIQLETAGSKSKQTRGTQLTKLAVINLLASGVPTDVEMTAEEWQRLTMAEKQAASPVYSLVKKNTDILNALTEKGYRDVLKSLGITETADGFQITNKKVVADYLAREAEARDLPDNIRDGIGVDEQTGDFIFPLEALGNYRAVKSMIYSIVDKKLMRPKLPGGPKIQVSSTMFESNNRKAVYKPSADKKAAWQKVTDYNTLTEAEKATVRLTSIDLKFYTRDAPYIEVLVPHWFKEKLRAAGSTKTDGELLAYLEKNKSELLTGIGFRIPTQEINSVEHIHIKGFLPQEMGDTIVVPSEIVVKAGSDFDVDKLNTYLKNFFINKEGFPESIKLVHADITSESGLRTIYDHLFGSLENFLRTVDRELSEQAERGTLSEENKLGISEEGSRLINTLFSAVAADLTEIGIDPAAYEKKLSSFIPFEKFRQLTAGKNIYQIYGMFNPAALENEYISSLQELLSLPQNFERLIQPNSADELKQLRNELNSALGLSSLETKGNFSLLLDPSYMSLVRHSFISGKDGVAIAALQQTNTAIAQLSGIFLDHREFESKLTALEKIAVKEVSIQLPHNTIQLEGETFINFSAIKDTIGRYISDKISGYINGFVDIAKDAFITELGATSNVARIFMFLEKAGVPTADVVMFMNQPIIRDYLRQLSISGLVSVHSESTLKIVNSVKGLYPASKTAEGPIDTSLLKGLIEKKAVGTKFTSQENGLQHQFLNEFLKYAVFADHLFALTQATNYDTEQFSDGALIFRKQTFSERARDKNLFNSVDRIFDNTFIGQLKNNLLQVKQALGEIFIFDHESIAPQLESMLAQYIAASGQTTEDDFLVIASRLQASLLDYLVQQRTTPGAGPLISELMMGQQAVAHALSNLKRTLPSDSDLASNLVLQQLEPYLDDTYVTEPQNIKLLEKAYDSYTTNLYTEGMRGLKQHFLTSGLYRNLVELSLLQSGSRRSPISYGDIIPVEDYAPRVKEATSPAAITELLADFAGNYAFQRVHYADERIVPTVEAKEFTRMYGNVIPIYEVPGRLYRNLGVSSQQNRFIRLNSHYQSRESNFPVVKLREIAINPATKAPYSPTEQAQMRKNGDYSFFKYQLFQKVMTEDADGNIVGLSFPDDQTKRPGAVNYIYKQINAWGKPGLVQEYYTTPRPSVLSSQQQVKEFTDTEVVNAFYGNPPAPTEVFLQLDSAPTPEITASSASAKTLRLAYNFLEKIGVDVQSVKQIVIAGKKIGGAGLADITRQVIQIVEGKHDVALMEETMHFAVEIIQQKHPALFNELANQISRYQLYADVLRLYGSSPYYRKDGKPDIIKLKKEAIARVLVETIISKVEGATENPELVAKAASWWQKIIDFLKNLFSRAGFDPFDEAAGKFIQGDIATPESSASDNSQRTPASETEESPYFLQIGPSVHQQNLAGKLLNIHRQLSKEVSTTDSTDSYYVIGGKRVANRVTNLAKKYFEKKFRHKQLSETELQRAINDQKREKGTDGHADLEDIFHRLVDDDGFLRTGELAQSLPSQLDPHNNAFYKILENNLRQRLHSFPSGSRFFSELMIYDEQQDLAGTIDFLAIEPDTAEGAPGKIHILDWKFINLKEDAADIPFYKKEAWNIQISEYVNMLSKPAYGAMKSNFGMTRAIPIKSQFTFADKERTRLKLSSVEIGNVNVKAITDDTLLPVPTRYESTGNEELDGLIYSLNNLHDKIYDIRSDPGTEYIKNQRLNAIMTAIRRLQMKQEAKDLFAFARNDIFNFNTFFKQHFDLLESGSTNLNDSQINELSGRILDADDVLALYKRFNVIFRGIFNARDNKAILDEAEMISDQAELVSKRLIRLSNSLRTNPIARGVEVEDMLQPEKVITWYQKWVRSISQGPTKASEILWRIVNRINTAEQIDFAQRLEQLKELESEVSGWLKATGRSFEHLQDLIFAKDEKGRWRGKVISMVSREFYSALTDALTRKDTAWILDNIDKQAYMEWFKEELEKRRASFQTSRLLEDEAQDRALKNRRLQDFKRLFDIENHRDTAISPINYRLKAFPVMEKWQSKEYTLLKQPENAAALKLFDYWQQTLSESYKLGLIKAWEQHVFFPNVRKDFLDTLAFGSQSGVAKAANLTMLNNIRIEAADEVMGFTDLNGNPQDRLAALYVYDLGNKIVDADGEMYTDYSNKSTDIFKVMALWNRELIKYRHKSEVVDTVRLLHFTERNRKAIGRSKRTGGIAYKQNGAPVEVDNIENSAYLKNYIDYYFYGKRLSEGQDVIFQFKYNSLAKRVNEFFRSDLMPVSAEDDITISGRKVLRAFNRFFQMKVLGVNLATAVTNFIGGKANAYMLAGKYFTKADYARAAFQLASAKFHTEEGKVYAGLLNYFMPLTEDRTGEYIRGLSVSRAVKLLSSDHLFYMMRSSDKLVQYPAALATFANTMIEDGKLVNIREHVKTQNNFGQIYQLPPAERKALRERIESEIQQLKDTRSLPVIAKIENDKVVLDGIAQTAKSIAGLRNTIQQFSKDALGNMSEEDISQYRLTLLGQSFMMFKNWIPRMGDVRFGEFRYQSGTDSYEWGRMSMLFNALKFGIVSGSKSALATLVGSSDGIEEIARRIYQTKKAAVEANGIRFNMTEADFIEMYIKGIRTQLKEIALLMSMMGIVLFAKSEVPDDDDDRTTGVFRWISRTLDKMKDELGFFLNPLSFTSIANGSVFPSVQLLNDIVKFMSSMTMESYYLVIDDEKAKEKNHVLKYLFKTFPVSKELMTYVAMFNDDLAKEFGIRITTQARIH